MKIRLIILVIFLCLGVIALQQFLRPTTWLISLNPSFRNVVTTGSGTQDFTKVNSGNQARNLTSARSYNKFLKQKLEAEGIIISLNEFKTHVTAYADKDGAGMILEIDRKYKDKAASICRACVSAMNEFSRQFMIEQGWTKNSDFAIGYEKRG